MRLVHNKLTIFLFASQMNHSRYFKGIGISQRDEWHKSRLNAQQIAKVKHMLMQFGIVQA